MSILTDPVIFCEGRARGADVRLLEAARNALLGSHPIAARVEIRPAGSVGDLGPLLRLYADAPRPVRAIRDRDFLPRSVVEQQRRKVIRPFPLGRHCIESYLLDAALVCPLVDVTGPEYEATRHELARRRLWTDVARGVVARYVGRHRLHPRAGEGRPDDRGGTIGAVETALNVFAAEVETRLEEFVVTDAVDAMREDFRRDGPPWTRVDGKALLHALRDTFDPTGARFGSREAFVKRLVDRAERRPPRALVDDLARLLEHIQPARTAP